MKLEIRLHGHRAALLSTGYGGGTPPDEIELTTVAARLSARWLGTDGPTPDELNRRLDNLRPEQGASTWYKDQAERQLVRLEIHRSPRDASEQIRAHANAEYPGAVTFVAWTRNADQPLLGIQPARTLNELEVARTLVNAQQIWDTGREEWPGHHRLTYSSGMRGKFGVRLRGDSYEVPATGELTTHIVKHEDRAQLASEAGAEAACQRALKHAGVRAAPTVARVFEGVQALVSTRSDRRIDTDGSVKPVHQEEWLQALSRAPGERHGWDASQGWEELAELLGRAATDPVNERRELIRMLAAAVILNHTDLHRRNIGLMHTELDQPPTVTLAPMYDVSSGDGRGAVWRNKMSIAIEGTDESDRITEQHWTAFARRIAMEPDEVLDTVDAMSRRLPDAFATARTETLRQDELRHPSATRQRLEEIQTAVHRRAWSNQRHPSPRNVLEGAEVPGSDPEQGG